MKICMIIIQLDCVYCFINTELSHSQLSLLLYFFNLLDCKLLFGIHNILTYVLFLECKMLPIFLQPLSDIFKFRM